MWWNSNQHGQAIEGGFGSVHTRLTKVALTSGIKRTLGSQVINGYAV